MERSRVVDFAGDLMTESQYKSLRLSDFGGTFVSPESGARGENVLASYFCCEEQREDEDRVNGNDRLHRFVSMDEIEDVPSDDMSSGPRFVDAETISRQPLYDLLKMGGPAYVVRVYEMAGERGRLDLLNRLPNIVARLKTEGVFSLGLFKQTNIEVDGRRFSASAILRGHAAEELRVIGPEGGVACQILKILGSF